MGVFNVCAPLRTSLGGTHWVTLGRAWESKKDGKRRILVKLNALPIEGRDLHLFEREEEDEDPRLPDGTDPDNLGFLDDLPF